MIDMKAIALVYCILSFCLLPIIICLLPVIPAIITDNDNYAWFMIFTVPVGMASCGFFWGKGLDWAFDKFMP